MPRTERDFNFLTGLLKCRERELGDEALARELVSARSMAEVVATLPPCRFTQVVGADPTDTGVERAATEELAALWKLVADHAPVPELAELVATPLDIHNLKTALLGHLRGEPSTGLYQPTALVAADVVTEVGELSTARVPLHYLAAIQVGLTAYYESDRSPQALELAMDRSRSLLMVDIASRRSPALAAVLADWSDLAVAETIMRGKDAGLPWRVVRWGSHGLPEQARLQELFDSPTGEWAQMRVFARPLLTAAVQALGQGEGTREAILRLQTELTARLGASRYAPASIEYVYYFVRRKLTDLANFRVACLGALRDLSNDAQAARLNLGFG